MEFNMHVITITKPEPSHVLFPMFHCFYPGNPSPSRDSPGQIRRSQHELGGGRLRFLLWPRSVI